MRFPILVLILFSVFSCSPTYVRTDPPVEVEEVIPARPHAGFFWVSGHYAWRKGRWVWISGHWKKMRPGRVWIAGYWKRTPRGWMWVEGRWSR